MGETVAMLAVSFTAMFLGLGAMDGSSIYRAVAAIVLGVLGLGWAIVLLGGGSLL